MQSQAKNGNMNFNFLCALSLSSVLLRHRSQLQIAKKKNKYLHIKFVFMAKHECRFKCWSVEISRLYSIISYCLRDLFQKQTLSYYKLI